MSNCSRDGLTKPSLEKVLSIKLQIEATAPPARIEPLNTPHNPLEGVGYLTQNPKPSTLKSKPLAAIQERLPDSG